MTPRSFRSWCLLLVCLYALALTAPAVGGEIVNRVQKNTICVGHYLIDISVPARVSVSGTYKGISVRREGADDFSGMERALRARSESFAGKQVEQDSYREAIYRSGGVDPGKLFGSTQLLGFDSDEAQDFAVLGYHRKPGDAAVRAEAHRLYDGQRFVFTVDNIGADKYPAMREGLLDATSRYVPLVTGRMPQQDGFCIGSGLFIEAGSHDVGGDATLVANFPDHPNVTFSIDVSGIQEPSGEPSLQSRADGEMGFISRLSSSIKPLRRGRHTYAGQDGYEIGVSVLDEEEGGTIQKLIWSAEGKPKDPVHPFIEMQLIAGESGPSPLSDEEFVALWEVLVSGFRVRNGS